MSFNYQLFRSVQYCIQISFTVEVIVPLFGSINKLLDCSLYSYSLNIVAVESKTVKQLQQYVSTSISSTALEKVHQLTEENMKLKEQLQEKEIENDKLQKTLISLKLKKTK